MLSGCANPACTTPFLYLREDEISTLNLSGRPCSRQALERAQVEPANRSITGCSATVCAP